MSATAMNLTACFLNNSSSPTPPSFKTYTKLGTCGALKRCSRSLALQVVKVHARAGTPQNVNGYEVDQIKSSPMPDLMKLVHQLPGSNDVFNAIPKADEDQLNLLVKNLVDSFSMGEIVNGGPVFRQNYCIRSYDLGPNQSASLQTLMNLIQETSLNHTRIRGVLSDGFGSTPEMTKRNLIWVVTKFHIVVDRYPSWGDVVEVNTWVSTHGKNSIQINCSIRDSRTGEIFARSTSVSMMMNKHTRKLSKFPPEFAKETESFMLHCDPILDENSMKLPKFDDNNMEYVQTGLIPIWNDLDVNQHVSHVKYSGWMVQTVPDSILKTHELAAITMEFRRECGLDSVIQSQSSVVDDDTNDGEVKSIHLLRLENGTVVAKGWTKWRPKDANNTQPFGKALSP